MVVNKRNRSSAREGAKRAIKAPGQIWKFPRTIKCIKKATKPLSSEADKRKQTQNLTSSIVGSWQEIANAQPASLGNYFTAVGMQRL